jgi:hypothetical protein
MMIDLNHALQYHTLSSHIFILSHVDDFGHIKFEQDV